MRIDLFLDFLLLLSIFLSAVLFSAQGVRRERIATHARITSFRMLARTTRGVEARVYTSRKAGHLMQVLSCSSSVPFYRSPSDRCFRQIKRQPVRRFRLRCRSSRVLSSRKDSATTPHVISVSGLIDTGNLIARFSLRRSSCNI